MPDLFFRPRTWDENIWKSVAAGNEYCLPKRFAPGATVIDVGAHIGAFTYACLDRGAALAVAVEADPENARLWQHNIHRACAAADRSVLLTAGCWRSDRAADRPIPQWLRVQAVGANTGGSHVGEAGVLIRAVALDAVIDLALSLAPGRIALLKLDCEGSEWPILFTSRRLNMVDEIVGEYHQPPTAWDGPNRLEDLIARLTADGFDATYKVTDKRGLGLFHAWRGAPSCCLCSHAVLQVHEPWLLHTVPAAGRLALDIGANRGAWSRVLAKRFERVVAFEPQPEIAEHLASVPGLDVRCVALWDKPASLTLYHNGYDGQCSAVRNQGHRSTSTTEAVTLDSLALEPDFLKLDAEGAELRILRGAEKTIRTHRPAMLIECHNHLVSGIEKECRSLLAAWGFEFEPIANPVTPAASTWLWCK